VLGWFVAIRQDARVLVRFDRKVGVEPIEGALVRLIADVLTRRRYVRAWRDGALGSIVWIRGVKTLGEREVNEGVGVRLGGRASKHCLATRGVRGPLVRFGFLSRWAQEVGGRRRSLSR